LKHVTVFSHTHCSPKQIGGWARWQFAKWRAHPICGSKPWPAKKKWGC
jgi:hypothetical protein